MNYLEIGIGERSLLVLGQTLVPMELVETNWVSTKFPDQPVVLLAAAGIDAAVIGWQKAFSERYVTVERDLYVIDMQVDTADMGGQGTHKHVMPANDERVSTMFRETGAIVVAVGRPSVFELIGRITGVPFQLELDADRDGQLFKGTWWFPPAKQLSIEGGLLREITMALYYPQWSSKWLGDSWRELLSEVIGGFFRRQMIGMEDPFWNVVRELRSYLHITPLDKTEIEGIAEYLTDNQCWVDLTDIVRLVELGQLLLDIRAYDDVPYCVISGGGGSVVSPRPLGPWTILIDKDLASALMESVFNPEQEGVEVVYSSWIVCHTEKTVKEVTGLLDTLL